MLIIIKNFHFQKGLTLIELMIAIVISIILLLGTTTLFMSNKRSYKTQEELGRLQENARFAMDLMIKDIRLAGFSGCAHNIDQVNVQLNDDPTDSDLLKMAEDDVATGVAADRSVEGSENAANWSPTGSIKPAAMLAGTDGISIRFLNGSNSVPITNSPPTDGDLTVPEGSGINENEIVAISDCDSMDVFQVTKVTTSPGNDDTLEHGTGAVTYGPGNASASFGPSGDPYSYGDIIRADGTEIQTNATIFRFMTRRYFIGTGASGGPSLFRIGNNGAAEELIDGVENMQILYGEDTTPPSAINNVNTPTTYVTADAVGNWANVVSVRIGLLMRTVDENFNEDKDTQVYTLLGTDLGPYNDKRVRRMFTSTVLLRNRQY